MLQRLNQAIELARKINDGRNFRHAAIAIRADGTVVQATNLMTQIPMARGHAEARVCLKLDRRSVVYVARVLKNGDPALSKPCPNCERAMRARGIEKVYYTISKNEYECLRF